MPDLLWLRRYLSEFKLYVGDSELREEVTEWVEESRDMEDAASAADYVRSGLLDVTASSEMYHSPTVKTAQDAFPTDCEDCRHYGSSCPILHDETTVRARERKLAEADTEAEAREVWEEQAERTGCVVIPGLLSEWGEDYQDFISRGYELYNRINDRVDESGDGESPEFVDEDDDVLMGL